MSLRKNSRPKDPSLGCRRHYERQIIESVRRRLSFHLANFTEKDVKTKHTIWEAFEGMLKVEGGEYTVDPSRYANMPAEKLARILENGKAGLLR